MNVAPLLSVAFACSVLFFLAGYITARVQLNNAKKRIRLLEREKLDDHAAILQLQKENTILQSAREDESHYYNSGDQTKIA